jgi:hypothetical protein
VEAFAAVLWLRLDRWYGRRPALRLRVHRFFYNVFEEEQPKVFRSAMVVQFRRSKRLENVYWREMSREGAKQNGMHWADLEPVEPEPPFEDGPRPSDEYVPKHHLCRMSDRRNVRYRMLPCKRSGPARGGGGGRGGGPGGGGGARKQQKTAADRELNETVDSMVKSGVSLSITIGSKSIPATPATS